MITKLFLGFTLLGAQWVLWLLILVSIISIALILDRWTHFKSARRNLETALERELKGLSREERVLRGEFITQRIVADARLNAERRLSWLATIGSNAPFVGLFGTVLGIIRAFHDLSQAGTQGSAAISSGISEALVATAVGLFVAIPAVVAYNYFQREVKNMILIADRTKNSIFGQS